MSSMTPHLYQVTLPRPMNQASFLLPPSRGMMLLLHLHIFQSKWIIHMSLFTFRIISLMRLWQHLPILPNQLLVWTSSTTPEPMLTFGAHLLNLLHIRHSMMVLNGLKASHNMHMAVAQSHYLCSQENLIPRFTLYYIMCTTSQAYVIAMAILFDFSVIPQLNVYSQI